MRLIMEQRTKYRFDFKSWDQSLLLVWFFKLGLLLIIEIQGSLNLEISQELQHQCFIQKPRLALHVTTTYSCLCNFQSVNTRPFPINMSKLLYSNARMHLPISSYPKPVATYLQECILVFQCERPIGAAQYQHSVCWTSL